MALINRISRLFTADFHAVLDRIEEPELLLKQAIREMENELAHAQQRISICTHDQEALARRIGQLETSVAEHEAQLDLCFESDKNDLARSVIKKKLETEQLRKRLQTRYAENARQLDEQRTAHEQNQITLESLRQKAALFDQHTPTSTDSDSDHEHVSDDEIEIAYLRERSLRSAT